MQVFDSNGPDVRIRGTAHQVCEKYLALAKDSASAGDIILAESYMQHAEHYQRIINDFDAADERNAQNNDRQQQGQQNQQGQQDGNNNRNRNKKEGGNEDLSLPSSILGDNSKAEEKTGTQERTGEFSPAE